MDTTLGIETPWQTPWQGIHWTPISETQGKTGSRVPLIHWGKWAGATSDFINFVLQVAEQGIQAFGGTPQLLEHEAFFLIHIFKHRFQEAPNEAFRLLQHLKGNAQALLAGHRGLCSRTYLACEAPVNLPMPKARGGWGWSPGRLWRWARSSWRTEWSPRPPNCKTFVFYPRVTYTQYHFLWASWKSLGNIICTSLSFLFIICETGKMIPNSSMVGITE